MRKLILLAIFSFISATSTSFASDEFDENVTQIKAILSRINTEEVSIADMFEMTLLAEGLSDAAHGECLEEIKPSLNELILGIYIARQSIRKQEEFYDDQLNELEGRIEDISLADILEIKMKGKYISRAYLHLGMVSDEISKAAFNSTPCE